MPQQSQPIRQRIAECVHQSHAVNSSKLVAVHVTIECVTMLVARSGWGRAAVLAARAAATSTSSPSRSEHWYDLKTGSPFVPQDRSERRPMASTAGQRGLVPSVTTIMSIVHKRNLDYWRTSTMLQAAVEIHEKLLLEHQARVLHDRLVEQGEISESDIVQASMLLQSAVDGGNLPGMP